MFKSYSLHISQRSLRRGWARQVVTLHLTEIYIFHVHEIRGETNASYISRALE